MQFSQSGNSRSWNSPNFTIRTTLQPSHAFSIYFPDANISIRNNTGPLALDVQVQKTFL